MIVFMAREDEGLGRDLRSVVTPREGASELWHQNEEAVMVSRNMQSSLHVVALMARQLSRITVMAWSWGSEGWCVDKLTLTYKYTYEGMRNFLWQGKNPSQRHTKWDAWKLQSIEPTLTFHKWKLLILSESPTLSKHALLLFIHLDGSINFQAERDQWLIGKSLVGS